MLRYSGKLGKKAERSPGGEQQALTKAEILDFSIEFPINPEEQKRIVKVLDDAFAGIATAKANAGKNLENARALFDSYLRSHLLESGRNWKEKPLVELCYQDRVITYGVIKLGEHTHGGVPCLRTSNVRWLRIETKDMKVITKELSNEYSRTIIKGGEILVNVRGTLGGVAVVPQEMIGWNVSREVAVVPINQTMVNPAFIAYSIASSHSQDWLSEKKKGAAYVGINIEDLRCLPIRFPPIAEQAEVVAQLKAVEAQAQALADVHARKVDELDALKKSVLNEAFSGNL